MRTILLSVIISLSATLLSAQDVKAVKMSLQECVQMVSFRNIEKGINIDGNFNNSIEKPVMIETQDSDFGSIVFVFLVATIVLIYLITVRLYHSLLSPVIVLFAIPLSLIMAFPALALTINDFTVFNIIGSIVLIDMISINAVLLVNFAGQMKRKGKDAVNALIDAGKERLRPILITAFVLMSVMLLFALTNGNSNSAESKNIITWGIIGGFANAMALSLIVVPVVYLIFYKMASKLKKTGNY